MACKCIYAALLTDITKEEKKIPLKKSSWFYYYIKRIGLIKKQSLRSKVIVYLGICQKLFRSVRLEFFVTKKEAENNVGTEANITFSLHEIISFFYFKMTSCQNIMIRETHGILKILSGFHFTFFRCSLVV